jgi:hypothetical protein
MSGSRRTCARAYRSRGVNGSTAPELTVGLRLRSDPFERHGRIWQWVLDLDPGLPTVTDVLVNCHDFLVDDNCGRELVWSNAWIRTQTQPLQGGCV